MNEQKREQLIEWLESMPWWAELPYAALKRENESLRALFKPGDADLLLTAEEEDDERVVDK